MNGKAFALISLMVSRKGGAIKQFLSCICETKGTTDILSSWKMLSGGENRCLNLDDKLFILRPIIYYGICKSSATLAVYILICV